MKLRFMGMAAAAVALAVPAIAWAASSDGGSVTLPKGQTHTGTYYAAGSTVTVDGDVSGDVICGGQDVTIDGSVSGDVICAGQSVTINGPVGGSVRAIGQIVTINGTVGRNVTAASQSLKLGSGATVSGEVALAGQTVTVDAPVNHAMYVGSNDLTLNSTVGGDVNAAIAQLTMGSNAHVAGSFTYTSSDSFSIDKSKVSGDVVHHAKPKPAPKQTAAAAWLGRLLYWVVASTAAMLLAVWLLPRLVRGVTDMMLRRPQSSFGWGLIGIIIIPILLFALVLTVVGIPLAILLTILWITVLVVSGLFAGVAVGRLILGRKTPDQRFLLKSALVGVPLAEIALAVPWLGGLLGLIAAVWVLGAVLLGLNRARALG